MAMEPWTVLGLVLGGSLSGFVNVLAGGGSLITLPLLIFLGLPATAANGTNRLSILLQSGTAAWRFHRQNLIDWGLVARLLGPLWLGALSGAWLASQMSDTDFKALIGWLSLVAGALTAFDVRRIFDRTSKREATSGVSMASCIAMLFVGLYGGLAQAGVGYLFLAALTLFLRKDLVEATALKVVLTGAYTPVAIGVFQWQSQVSWPHAIALSAGSIAGAQLGAGLAIRTNARFVRPLVAILIMAAAFKLVWDAY
ncbi:MAG TPA: sulfite exporter TauE/SafE family protein [Myxococcales bacterium LLY-WYZ-16_1]|jgi:uncharacterized protein|nr:sulfite exporter TauE/SafE family protein [Myxococcales bacterium LLY-WYZ-16_1]